MSVWLWLLFGGPLIALLIRQFLRIPRRPKILHTPYARPGPWHYSKLLVARVWLAYRLVRHPRVLNTFDMKSKKYDKLGVVATELEKYWELPKKLIDRESLDGMFFYGTDGLGTFLKLSINRQLNRQAEVSFLFVLPNGTTYQLPNAPDTTICNTDGQDTFNAGGIKFQLVEAMRKWRIIFNGLAKRTQNGEETEVHLRINMIWSSLSRPYEFKREFSRKLLAAGMARELWRGRQEWWRMSEPEYNGVDQWGAMCGTYQEGSLSEDKELYLRGIRQRRWGQNHSSTLHRKLDIIGTCEDGNFFYLSATSDSSRLTHEVWGHLYHPNGFLYKINACNLDLEKLGENGPVPRHFSLRFSAKRRHYHAIMHLMPNQFENFTGTPWRHQSTIYPCHLTLNARQGRVLFTATNTFHGHCPLVDVKVSSPYLAAPSRAITPAEDAKIVLLFNEEACRFERLVGGKGSSLALLSSYKEMPAECGVPQGFCITVNAWKRQINDNKDLLLPLKALRDVGKGVIDGGLEEYCREASILIASAPVDHHVQDCIREALQELFGDEVENKRLAIRSSAIGEDGEEVSSAGQNATVLGCKGYDAVIKGLQQCWSSLLSYQSVEYRRQHGQPLIPGMGVVVQEMVDSEVAGVLFTVNPNDGNPGKMILSSNYGLGESVVSASAEPDTFIVKRTSSGQLSVLEKTIGSKQLKIVLSEDGTRQEQVDAHSSQSLTLSDEVALQLAHLGLHLEQCFGGPRDIEFAIRNNRIYLLQARPVTALDSWSDYEIRHEFDTPTLTDGDYLTKANTGEVVPGAATPLCISTTLRIIESNFKMVVKKQFGRLVEADPWSIGRFYSLQQNQLFISVVNAFLRDVDAEISDNIRAIDMAVFGHIVTTPAIHRLGVQRFGVAGFRVKYRRYRTIIYDFLFNSRRIRRAETKFSDYSFPVDQYSDPKTLYGEICVRLPILSEIGRTHTTVSRASATTQLIAFMILLEGRKEWTPELYAEMAQLLGSISTVESAEVPVALKDLARAISTSEFAQDFVKESTDDALKTLQNDKGAAGNQLRDFLERHGHRSIMEFDFYTETWGLNPLSLISALQTMVANPQSFASAPKKEENDWLDNIQKTNAKKHRLLKFLVPRSRDAVAGREKTKSLLIRTIHCFRLAYRRLGQLMVWDGVIPDAGLVFFLTHSELQEVINSRGVSLISKAIRRRKLYPEMNALVFPEMSLGIPKALPDAPSEEAEPAVGVELTGTPVFRGKVRATARVAVNLQEARDIQCGEILITRSTDIGWSPYFPLLAGVVTELGGLISHGAVVAREYGLPCIVGAQKVTHVFRTGDTVILDGTNGTITRVDAGPETE